MGPGDFPDRKGFIRLKAEKGLKVCVWINPYIDEVFGLRG